VPEAGPALEAAVAEAVLGLVPCDKWEDFNLGSAGGLVKARMTKDFPIITTQNAPTLDPLSGSIDMRSNYQERKPEDCCPHKEGECYPRGFPAHYSRNIQAAWVVVERLRSMYRFVTIGVKHDAGVHVAIDGSMLAPEGSVEADADTAPLAVCLAALKYVKSKKGGRCA